MGGTISPTYSEHQQTPFLLVKPEQGSVFYSSLCLHQCPFQVSAVLHPGWGNWRENVGFDDTLNYVPPPIYHFTFRVLKQLIHASCLQFIAAFNGRDREECIFSILTSSILSFKHLLTLDTSIYRCFFLVLFVFKNLFFCLKFFIIFVKVLN